jgi:hypothetical protein
MISLLQPCHTSNARRTVRQTRFRTALGNKATSSPFECRIFTDSGFRIEANIMPSDRQQCYNISGLVPPSASYILYSLLP